MLKLTVFFTVFFIFGLGFYDFVALGKNTSVEVKNYFVYEAKVSSMEPLKRETFFTGDDSILSSNDALIFENIGTYKITAYSSTVGQTDDTPFIMASGNHVYSGAVATNFLPLGTLVKFPELYGNKIFVVEDRMNKRFQDRIDIWFESKTEAKSFGLKYTKVEVAEK